MYLTFLVKVISRLQEYIYPAIDGKQLARLLYYYMLFNECVQSAGLTYEVRKMLFIPRQDTNPLRIFVIYIWLYSRLTRILRCTFDS